MSDDDEEDLRGPAPTIESLTSVLGFTPPDDLVKLARFAWDVAGPTRDRIEVGTVLLSVVGFELDPSLFGEPASERLYVPPPEYVPFGWTGYDGVSFGFLVHGPELQERELPLVVADPYRHDEGARRLADDFRIALERTASWPLRHEEEPDAETDALRARLVAMFGIAPTRAKAKPFGRLPAREPAVPPGWHHRQGLDGVGVLAPKEAFAPQHRRPRTPKRPPRGRAIDVEAVVESARRHVADGHPASAVSVANDAYHAVSGFCIREIFGALLPVRLEAYGALGRALHVRALERTTSP
ncbi:MAG: hypothetical protein ACHREM_25265 [Polyangiales bacterium]